MGSSQIITNRRHMQTVRYNDRAGAPLASYKKMCIVDLSGKMENCIFTRKFYNTPEWSRLWDGPVLRCDWKTFRRSSSHIRANNKNRICKLQSILVHIFKWKISLIWTRIRLEFSNSFKCMTSICIRLNVDLKQLIIR